MASGRFTTRICAGYRQFCVALKSARGRVAGVAEAQTAALALLGLIGLEVAPLV
jgi:hypothetical protein